MLQLRNQKKALVESSEPACPFVAEPLPRKQHPPLLARSGKSSPPALILHRGISLIRPPRPEELIRGLVVELGDSPLRTGTHDRRLFYVSGVSLFQEDLGRAALHLMQNLLPGVDFFNVQSVSDRELDERMSPSLFQILYGCIAQYTIMPTFGFIVSKILGLSRSLSVGLILLGSCPGGTASNVVTLIARGDVPLSIVMTVCTTLGAVILTPLLTKILAGTYVPIDAFKLSISTLQVVVAPVLLGSWLQSAFPQAVNMGIPFAPLLAVLASSLLASSVFSENVVRLKSSFISTSMPSDASLLLRVQAILSSELGVVVLSVLLLHLAGFFVGYLAAAFGGFKEPQRRAISIEVGMQNSSLGVVLATSHFASSMVALPSAISAVLMNIMGSSLGYFWMYNDPSDPKEVAQK